MAEPKMADTSTTSSITSTSHTMTAWPTSATQANFSNPHNTAYPSPMADLLAALAPSNRHTFIAPPASLPNTSLEFAKSTLDTFAGKLGDEQAQRLKELRNKRKRGEVGEDVGEVLKIRKVHTEGFAVQQVWEQARRVIDSLRGDAERGLRELGGEEADSHDEDEVQEGEVDGGVELMKFDEDGFEVESDDEELEGEEEDEMEGSGSDDVGDDVDGHLESENAEMDDEFDGEDDYDEEMSEDDEPTGVFVEDPNGLNDGFFSIDEFNKQTEFLEQQDATADPNTGEASDEEDIDWDANPLGMTTKPVSSSRRAAAMDIDDDEDEDEELEDDAGPTFGNMDLNAAEGESDDEDEDADMDEGMDTAGDNTNDVTYKDFFAPPPRKAGKGERQAKYLERQSQKAKAAEPEDDGADIERAMADVRRDLFDDLSDDAGSEAAMSDLDPADPKSRRSAHERRQAKLAEEIRRLEAASVAKREWTLSGEARAADRPQNSLLDEDLDFERTGKPVPVITAEVSENIEDLIKRRILAREFDEVVRRRPDSLTPANTRRGAFELDDTKPQQSLAEMYEEEHVKNTNPDTYVSQADEKMLKEEKEIEALWKEASAKLDALSSWHYKPKPAAPSLTVVADVATISMEDAQPTTASGINGGESMLAPQEIYKAGQNKDTITPGEVVPKSGAPVARQEMTRQEKLRRRRREKERIKKRGDDDPNKRPEGKKAQKKRETIGELKKGGVMVIGRKGEIRDVEGNKVQAAALVNGAGGFKL
ncbi:putative U3 small nucleolar ribonucleo protein mpp10 [Venustampulla echinocandica]|uniref:U3 small nucleolar ribonucleoprotein protein MPP10 n=1 Tax=Venustampulla echinocandica TaxID=2656787 RepID=A0A370TQT9_9HELO|nr:putative U3 small nucleolar ribonucleo protein mpp10 [Venustampulla echinocandica]RDL37890.1 putative U3 small nucleolar ribonucleo protein mpp10 [Venustampulla echinocandica]